MCSVGEHMVDLVVSMKAQGLDDMVKNSAKVAANLKSASDSSNRTAMPVRAASGETKTARSIGMGAGTGSAASDFAAQAQGLGGLVHVYATFAANIYALSAAFGALSKAMDVSNLVKGLDQLGAQSGKSLGSMAKQMIMLTDGALSLQQAMRSTALSTSGGISNENMLRMTLVAKKASLALGRDLPDSMDRLTKGIIKVQPELLDELGIMARVIPAQQAYARSIGKSVASLTDFEKRQAFTNAVLEEGERKFNAIDLISNPYSKLSASIQNLMQNGLELVNTVLTPILSILSSSPTALTGAMAFLGTTLLSQALPAIGAFRQNLQKLANESRDMAVARAAEARKGHEEAYKNAKSAALDEAKSNLTIARKSAEEVAEARLASVEAVEAKIKKYRGIVSKGTAAETILNKELPDVTDKDIARLELSAKQQSANKKAADLQREYATTLKGYKAAELEYLQKEKAATESLAFAQQKYAEEAEAAAKQQVNSLGILNTLKQNQLLADRALRGSVSQSITAQAANTAATKGFAAAWKEATASVANARAGIATIDTYVDSIDEAGNKTRELATITAPAMGRIQGGWTLLKAGVTGATGAVTTFLNFAGPWIQIIGLVTLGVNLLYNALSKSREANDKFNSSINAMDDAVKTAADTLDRLKSVGFSEDMGVDSIQARANAFLSLSDSISSSLTNFSKLEKLKNPMENFVDRLYAIFGKGDSDLLYKGIAKSLQKSFDLISDPKLQKEYQSAVNGIFGKDIDISKLEDALGTLSSTERLKVLGLLSEEQKKFNQELNNSASAGTSLKESLKALGLQVTDYTTKLLPNDDYAKFGLALAKIYDNITSKYLQSASSIASIQAEIKANPILGIFAPTAVREITRITLELERLTKAKEALANNPIQGVSSAPTQGVPNGVDPEAFKKAQQQFNSSKFTRNYLPASTQPSGTASNTEAQQIARLIGNQIASKQLEAVNAQGKLVSELRESINKQISYSEKRAQMEGSIAIRQAELSVRSSYGDATGRDSRKLIMQEFALRKQDIEMKYEMYEAQKSNTEALIDLTDIMQLSTAAVDPKTGQRTGKTASGEDASKIISSMEARKLAKETTIQSDLVERAKTIALNKLAAEQRAQMVKNADQIAKEDFSLAQSRLDLEGKSLSLSKQKNDLQSQYTQGFSKSLSDAMLQTDLDISTNKYQKERNILQNNYAHSATDAYKKQLTAQIELLDKTEAQEKLALRVNAAYANSQKILTEQVKLLDRSLEISKLQIDLSSTKDKSERDSLNYYREIGAITESELIKRTAILDKEKAIRDEKLTQAQIDRDKAQQLGELSNRQKAEQLAAGGGTLSPDQQAKFDAEKSFIMQVAEMRSTNAATQAASELASIDRNSQLKSLLADQNDAMKRMVETTTSLTTIFGDLGDSVGKVGEAILAMSQSDTQYLEQKKALQADLDSAEPKSAKEKSATKALMALEAEKTKKDIANNSAILSSSKKLFGEKTAMYKVLDNAEKISAGIKLAGQLKEIALDFKTFAIKIGLMESEVAATAVSESAIVATKAAAAPAKVAADVPSILSSFSSMGPVGYAIGAALVASLLAMVGGGGGGGGQVDMTGLTSEDRQRTQGTGQAYVNGVLTDTGGGVFGDSSAKSKTIVDALVTLKENSIEGLDYDNQMLKAMQKLADSVTGAAKSLYAIPGLRAGTGFGTTAGSSSTKGAFGSMFGNIPLIGGIGGKLLDSVFGGGTSSSAKITSAGVLFKGTFKTVMNDVEGSILQYKDVLKEFHKDGGWFGSDSDWSELNTETQALKADQRTALSDIFKDASELFVELGTKTGVAKTQIDSILSSFDISMPVDLMNLTGQALVDELNAIVGSKISDAAKLIFTGFDKFKNFGEDYLATVVRVVDANDKVDQSLRSIGSSFSIIGKFDISEAMVKAADGLENFMSQASFFKDNFLSNAEKLAPVQKSVNDQLTKLGISTSITKDQYKDLVLSQDLTTEAGKSMYQSLMELAPGFNTVRTEIASYISAISDQEAAIYTLLGKPTKALEITRAKELEALDAALRPRQLYINALTDEVAIRDKLRTAYTTTNTSLVTSIKTLEEYKLALTAGAASTLTPAEKYAQAKSIFLQTAAVAQSVITTSSTAAEVAARDAAITKIQSTGDALLSASKEVNASGAQYAADFASVTDSVDKTVATLTNQKSDMQKQLGFLETTAVATETMAQLLSDYLKAQEVTALAQAVAVAAGSTAATLTIPGHAKGGLAKGISIVGEKGPEIVDFVNPGRVYSNQASNDLFNTKELVEEIKALRNEVAQLREDQNKQTGDLIKTTIQSNAQNAQVIANATAETANQQAWKTRSQVKIA